MEPIRGSLLPRFEKAHGIVFRGIADLVLVDFEVRVVDMNLMSEIPRY